jgi:hypothetical protein
MSISIAQIALLLCGLSLSSVGCSAAVSNPTPVAAPIATQSTSAVPDARSATVPTESSTLAPSTLAPSTLAPSTLAPSTEQSTTVAARPEPPEASNPWAATALSPNQLQQLAGLLMERDERVLLPTYLPKGFRLDEFKAASKNPNAPPADNYSYYYLQYKGPSGTCLHIDSVSTGMMGAVINATETRSLSTGVAEFEMQIGTGRTGLANPQQIRYSASLKSGYLISTGTGDCQTLPIDEFEPVVQSIRAMEPQNP